MPSYSVKLLFVSIRAALDRRLQILKQKYCSLKYATLLFYKNIFLYKNSRMKIAQNVRIMNMLRTYSRLRKGKELFF